MGPNVTVEPGELYIVPFDGSDMRPLGDISEINCITSPLLSRIVSERDDIPDQILVNNVEALIAEIKGLVYMDKSIVMELFGITKYVLKDCPNKKVVHLAVYGKKFRTRRKNINRAFRILEKGEKRNG